MATVLSEQPRAYDHAAELFERYGTQIQRFCQSRLRCHEDAEDAVQSTFLRAHSALRKGVTPDFESAWLFKIAHNVCLSRAVATSRRATVENLQDLSVMQERLPAAEPGGDELIGLGPALAEMPENLRRPFLLREWQGMSYAEIADQVGASKSAVETLIFRARRHLARSLEESGKTLSRGLKALNLGPALGLLRSLLSGGGAKATAVGVAAAIGTAAAVTTTTLTKPRHPRHPAGAPASAPASPGQAAASLASARVATPAVVDAAGSNVSRPKPARTGLGTPPARASTSLRAGAGPANAQRLPAIPSASSPGPALVHSFTPTRTGNPAAIGTVSARVGVRPAAPRSRPTPAAQAPTAPTSPTRSSPSPSGRSAPAPRTLPVRKRPVPRRPAPRPSPVTQPPRVPAVPAVKVPPVPAVNVPPVAPSTPVVASVPLAPAVPEPAVPSAQVLPELPALPPPPPPPPIETPALPKLP